MPCVIHPSVTQVAFVFNRPYCARCRANIQAAVALLDAHVTPRDCFVWYAGGQDGWTPIAGTGCAHYVAHQLGIQLGGSGACCLAGFSYRVSSVIIGRQVDCHVQLAEPGVVSAQFRSTTSGSAQPAITLDWSRESMSLRRPNPMLGHQSRR